MPTLKTSEYTILQIVGLDAAVVSLSPGPQSQPLRLSSAATRVLQDVFLSIFFMLSFCHRGLNAYQLDGTWHITWSRIQLTVISTTMESAVVRTTTTVIGPNGRLMPTKFLPTVTGLT